MKRDLFKRLNPQPRRLILLDYDGTLTDFAKDPNKSHLPLPVRQLLKKLQKKHRVILVTGRNIDRLYRVSNLKAFPAVGTHGFETRHLPGGLQFASPTLQKRYQKEALAVWHQVDPLHHLYPGIHIEKKPFSSTLHYRGAQLSSKEIKKLLADFKRLSRKVITRRLWKFEAGKKLMELLPKDYSKGQAVKTLVSRHPGHIPLYAGDDVADVAALKVIGKKGVRVAVGPRIPGRYCDIRFKDPKAFTNWLKQLTE